MADGDVSKCGRKTALSTFFAVTFIAFTLSVISLISPSWQFVYLENGRTEHQHGLWLDCKRDFSFDYGRTREYYETLYRRDFQGSPFDIFFLPPLQCVYKFDYYIDPEDLYDHNHDENRIQNDAYQHLFLGWKIAALAGCGSAVLFSGAALLQAICAFCHRTFICASTVLVTIAAILSTIGISVFYAWANYQDNKVIKEDEDTIYEQVLGWAFYCHIVSAVFHWLASTLGCWVTSVSFTKTRAKLVKIEVVEGNDESQLLSGGQSSSQPFRRSFSAVYRVDSQSLRQWERDYLRNARERQQQGSENSFKRTVSMPNMWKKQRKPPSKECGGRPSRELFSSTSNITEVTHTGSMCTLDANNVREGLAREHVRQPSRNVQPTRDVQSTVLGPTARNAQQSALPSVPKLKSALKTPQLPRKSVNINDSDTTYEYLPCNESVDVSTFGKKSKSPTLLPRTYDPVYEQIGQGNYLEPDSVRLRSTTTLNIGNDKKALLPTQPLPGSSQSIPTAQPKSTLINDVARPSSLVDVSHGEKEMTTASDTRRIVKETEITGQGHVRGPSEREAPNSKIPRKPTAPSVETKQQHLSIRDFGISLAAKNGYCDVQPTNSSCENSKENSSSSTKYTKLEKTLGATRPSAGSPLKYVSVQKSSTDRLRELAGRPSASTDPGHQTLDGRLKTPRSANDTYDEQPVTPSGIAINTFVDPGRQRSITNLTFRPLSPAGVSEVFERPDSLTNVDTSPRKHMPLQQIVQRKLLSVMPDEVDRSVGSSTLLENETMRGSTDSYVRDAEIRLNLFMNDVVKDETTV